MNTHDSVLFPAPFEGAAARAIRPYESTYDWLCASNDPQVEREKAAFERLFAVLPDEYKSELYPRVRAQDDAVHSGGVFEVLVWHWLHAAQLDPRRIKSNGKPQPDFEVLADTPHAAFVEATTVQRNEILRKTEEHMWFLNREGARRLQPRSFSLLVHDWQGDSDQPSLNAFVECVRTSHASVSAGLPHPRQTDLGYHCFEFEYKNWRIQFEVLLTTTPRTGDSLFSMTSSGFNYDPTADQATSTLRRKRKHYDLSNHSLVIALASGDETRGLDDYKVAEALLGRSGYRYTMGDFENGVPIRMANGVWHAAGSDRFRREPIALIAVKHVSVYKTTKAEPVLWRNPYFREFCVFPQWPFAVVEQTSAESLERRVGRFKSIGDAGFV